MPTKGTVKPTADFSQIVKEIKKLSKGWTEVAKEQAKANQEIGKVAKNLTTQTRSISSLVKEVQRLSKSYKDLINQQKAAARASASSITRDKAKAREISKQIKLTDRLIQRGITQRSMAKQQATTGEILDYKNQVGRLKELQRQHGLTHKQVSRMWSELGSGTIKSYTGAQRRVLNQLVKIQAAQARLGATAKKAHSSALLARYNAEAQAFVKQRLALQGVAGQVKKTDGAVKGLLVSWKSFARLLAVQVFHQAVSAFIRATRDAIVEVIELEKRISEVQTISQELPLTFETWRDRLTEVSDAFGLPILDSVEGTYQALSNQITEGAKTLEFMTKVSQFAVTSVSSTADSVNLLTAALNAFNLEVDDTEEISAKFFKTIELGRVRAGEMANTFGRIAVPANQLTIRIEELQAAIASSTIQGLKYNEAATLIRNVLLKLIRPTDAMKELFKEWGVASGEAAIQTFGFSGVLARIEEKAQGSSTELGELFGRIRAITGAMLFAGEGLDRYQNALEEITNAQDDYGQRTAIVMENVGKRLDIEFNKIKNFFTVELADKWLRQLDTIFGGFENLTTVIKAAADTMTQIFIAGITAAGIAVVGLTAFIDKLNASLQRNILIMAAVGALYVRNLIARHYEGNIQEINDLIEKNQKEWKERELKNIDDTYKEKIKAVDDINKKELKALAEKATATKAQQESEKETYEKFIKLNKRLGKEVTQTIKSNISRLKKEIKVLDELIDRSVAQRELQENIDASTIARRLSGKDRFDQKEPTAERKYDFLNAAIIQAQEQARRAALRLDEEALDQAGELVEKWTDQLLAIRDSDKELSSLIHGQTFYNHQMEQLAESHQLMANASAKQKREAIAQQEEYEAMAVDAQRLVDFLSEKTLSDFFKIKDPLLLEATMNSQVRAVRELLKIQQKLGTDIKDPISLAKAVATIKLTASEQVRRLEVIEQQQRLQAIANEHKRRLENEKELIKLAREGMIHLQRDLSGVRQALWKDAIRQIQLLRTDTANRAAGGHGIDTQMARISPDEIVMNPAASRKFYSTLTAMNAGVQRFAGGGSPVYNIGDINLTADAQGGSIDIRKLGNGLRREIRRGRLKL